MALSLEEGLQVLGLDVDAETGAVRRAYARRLKQIDPARDPQAFQALREAYEAALNWIQARPQAAIASELPGDLAPMPTEARPEAARIGEAVFDEFASIVHAFRHERDAQAALVDSLADARLMNVDACHVFEWHVARLLLKGWQPGHDGLFAAACKAFDWLTDRQRVASLGPLQATLEAAIREVLVFQDQPARHHREQLDRIERLRDSSLPDVRWLSLELGSLKALERDFPHWLHIVAPVGRLHTWEADFERTLAGTWKAQVDPDAAHDAKDDRIGKRNMVWLGLILLLVLGFLSFADSQSRSGRSSPPRSQAKVLPEELLARIQVHRASATPQPATVEDAVERARSAAAEAASLHESRDLLHVPKTPQDRRPAAQFAPDVPEVVLSFQRPASRPELGR